MSKKPARDQVFMDIFIEGSFSDRIVFELFNDVAPKTAEIFRALCTKEIGIGKNTGNPLTYKGMVLHRVDKDFMIQGGGFTTANGAEGELIYGGNFEDEKIELQHDRPFLLSMANCGKDINGSPFFITTQPAPHLDKVQVVFGQLVTGEALLRQLETLPVDCNARPLQDITVTNCGQLVGDRADKKRKAKEENKPDCDLTLKKNKKNKKNKKGKKGKNRKEKNKKGKNRKEKNKKGKNRKEKNKKRLQSSSDKEGEAPEVVPLVKRSKIDPKDIPDIPPNKLMRGGPGRDKNDPRKNRESLRDRRAYTTRSGRIIKGRGALRYRTPSRSRSHSRAVTPPHWRQAQERIIKPDGLGSKPPANYDPFTLFRSALKRNIHIHMNKEQKKEDHLKRADCRHKLLEKERPKERNRKRGYRCEGEDRDQRHAKRSRDAKTIETSKDRYDKKIRQQKRDSRSRYREHKKPVERKKDSRAEIRDSTKDRKRVTFCL